MRISEVSSDVCSSDLSNRAPGPRVPPAPAPHASLEASRNPAPTVTARPPAPAAGRRQAAHAIHARAQPRTGGSHDTGAGGLGQALFPGGPSRRKPHLPSPTRQESREVQQETGKAAGKE